MNKSNDNTIATIPITKDAVARPRLFDLRDREPSTTAVIPKINPKIGISDPITPSIDNTKPTIALVSPPWAAGIAWAGAPAPAICVGIGVAGIFAIC